MRLGQTLEGTLSGVKGVASPFAFTALLLGTLIRPDQFFADTLRAVSAGEQASAVVRGATGV